MNAISIHESKSVFDRVDTVAYTFVYKVFDWFKGISRLPLLFAWSIGLVLLITVGLVYTILFYVPLLLVRKRLKRDVMKRLGVVASLPEREAMLELAHIEEIRITLEKAVRTGREFFVFLPLVQEIRKSVAILGKLEIALLARIHPESRKPLTPDQAEKLFEATLPWRGDWENQSMKVYDR